MRSEWQIQKSIKEGRDNEAADRVHAVMERVKKDRKKFLAVEAVLIGASLALVAAAFVGVFAQ